MTIHLPYNFTRDNDKYFFDTDNSVVYSVEFTDGSFYFYDLPLHIPVFELSIKVLSPVDEDIVQPYDERTEATIVAILSIFFEDNKNSLLYVCDNDGNRQQARFRKFEIWFNKNNTDNLEKYNGIIGFMSQICFLSKIPRFWAKDLRNLKDFVNLTPPQYFAT
jgi:hypothetical protein